MTLNPMIPTYDVTNFIVCKGSFLASGPHGGGCRFEHM